MLEDPLGDAGPAVGVQVPCRPESWRCEEDGGKEGREGAFHDPV